MKFEIGPKVRLGTLLFRLGTIWFQFKKLSPRVEGWDLVESGELFRLGTNSRVATPMVLSRDNSSDSELYAKVATNLSTMGSQRAQSCGLMCGVHTILSQRQFGSGLSDWIDVTLLQ